jgi:TonB family protein
MLPETLMRFPVLVLLATILACAAFGQNSAITVSKLPEDPRGMLDAAAPQYNFQDAALKPWQLKGRYRLFDENGNPGEEGTYEYWWISPQVYRSTWTRPSGARTEWHTEDGRTMYVASGRRILELEQELPSFLISVIPDLSQLKPGDAEIKNDELRVGNSRLPCVDIKWRKQKGAKSSMMPNVRAGTYCFDGSEPLLRVLRISNTEYLQFDHPQKTQGRIVAGEIKRSYGARDMFTFSLDKIEQITGDDAELKPPPNAKEAARDRDANSFLRDLEKQTVPVYPEEAKFRRLSGTVMFDALIGKDGKVQDLYLLASPSPILTKAVKDAVSQWKYKPYLLNGEPQENSMRIIMTFGFRY